MRQRMPHLVLFFFPALVALIVLGGVGRSDFGADQNPNPATAGGVGQPSNAGGDRYHESHATGS